MSRSNDAKLIFSSFTHYRRWINSLIPAIIPDVEVSSQQLNVLYFVRTEDASMADIARVLGVAPTVITGLVDRLEARGLIRRESHPSDRRRIQLVLTERGHEISSQVEAAVITAIQQQARTLDVEQREHLHEGLVLLEKLMADLEVKSRYETSADSAGVTPA